VTDYRANLGAHRRSLPCEHCGTEGRQKHDRTCPKAKRGRSARSRGNAYEREVAHKLGLERVGQFGGPEDVRGDWLNLQCKNGGAFPERIWRWLQALPADQRLRGVVIGDAPGPGTKRRNVIVLDLDDFADWFGGREATK